MKEAQGLRYGEYLKVEELLSLQEARSEPLEHDEPLFIVIHQVYELWFKLILHELDKVCLDLRGADLYGAVATLRRVRTVLKTLVAQIDVLETMTPLAFSSFRDRLETASGFQSSQFRELEFLLGNKRPEMLRYHSEGGPEQSRLQARLQAPSLVEALYDFLALRDVEIPAELRGREQTLPSEALQARLLEMYRTQPDLVILFELLLDFDQGLQEWRYRHFKMVERTIGCKRGTGGSEGANYLRKTLFAAVFPDLWAIRSSM